MLKQACADGDVSGILKLNALPIHIPPTLQYSREAASKHEEKLVASALAASAGKESYERESDGEWHPSKSVKNCGCHFGKLAVTPFSSQYFFLIFSISPNASWCSFVEKAALLINIFRKDSCSLPSTTHYASQIERRRRGRRNIKN